MDSLSDQNPSGDILVNLSDSAANLSISHIETTLTIINANAITTVESIESGFNYLVSKGIISLDATPMDLVSS